MKKKKDSFVNLGFSSLIMVFISIFLVTFTTLSVLTAYSDYRFSKKSADRATAYYTADAIARDALASIDAILFAIYQNSSSSVDYYKQTASYSFFKELPQNISALTIEQVEDTPLLSYSVAISNVQTLHVTLKIQYPQTGSDSFTTITRWQTVTLNESDEY